LESWTVLYIFLYNLFPSENLTYVIKRMPLDCGAFKLTDLTSFKVLSLHDFYGDADWAFNVYIRLYTQYTYTLFVNRQYFSLFKIFTFNYEETH